MVEKEISAGDIIFSEGDVADCAYIVVSGTVELVYLSNGGEAKAGTVQAGKVFGELAVFEPQELREYTARAIDQVVLQGVTQEEFSDLFSACPQAIQPFLLLAFEKFAPTKTRTKAPVSSLPKTDVEKITISAASDNLKAMLKPIEIPTTALPFRIGGYPEGSEKNRKDQLHLAIAAQNNPLLISRQHCEITVDTNDNLIINDLGSRFGTTVNGVAIGRGRGLYTYPLNKGNNDLFLGSAESKYRLTIACGKPAAKTEKSKPA